jgi:KUP system potassium uptake protein
METPDVPSVLRSMAGPVEQGVPIPLRPGVTSFYLGRETLIPVRTARAAEPPAAERLALWRKKLFVLMSRNAQSATAFFNLPPNRVVELGAQLQF